MLGEENFLLDRLIVHKNMGRLELFSQQTRPITVHNHRAGGKTLKAASKVRPF
jgi:hypothetical protein